MQSSNSGSLKHGSYNETRCSVIEEQVNYGEHVTTHEENLNNTRYFIIKSLNHQNIQLSVNKGIWATQVMNEAILEEAFQSSGKVVLIFSVNMSGFFQGYAQMMSSFGWRRDSIWSGKNNQWGRSFEVKWLCLHDLPFQKTLHLKNPWNDFKPVKISRDCQELPADIGRELCELLDHSGDINISIKWDEFSASEHSGRKNLAQQPQLYQNDFLAPPVQMPHALTPSLLYQQAEAIRYHSAYQTVQESPKKSLDVSRASKLMLSKNKETNGSVNQMTDDSSHTNSPGFSTEMSLFNFTFTEEDLLKMNYEEYLEAYTREAEKIHISATGPTSSLPKSSSSKEQSEDSQSRSSSKKRKH